MFRYLIIITTGLSTQVYAYPIFTFDYESNARLPAMVFFAMIALFIILVGLSYLANSFFLTQFKSSLHAEQQVAVAKLTTRRERVNQIYQAIREGFLFLPETLIGIVIIIALLTMVFLAFNFKIQIAAGSENYVYMFYLSILAFALFFQLWLVLRRFKSNQSYLNDQLQPLNLPESYIRKRLTYNILCNIFLFILGMLIWVPLIIAVILYPPELSPFVRVYFHILIGIFLMCVILRGLKI